MLKDEVVEIIKQGREGVKVTSNGVANFVEYPISSEEITKQIHNLFKAEVDKLTAIGDEEIEAWLYNRLGEGNVFEQFNRKFCKDLLSDGWQHTKNQLSDLMGDKEG